MKEYVSVALAALLAAACSNESKIEDRRVDLPPEPENGQQIVLPELEVPPGGDALLCWYTSLDSAADVWVRKFEVFQGEGGHHLVGFLTDEPVADGTVMDCSAPETMASLRPLLTGTDVHGFELPDGYAVRVPANAKLVFQTHYVNASDNPVKIRDVVNMHYADAGSVHTPVGSFANATAEIVIPPAGTPQTIAYECDVPQDLNVFFLFGHMHEWGQSIEISVGPAGSLQSVYSVDPWQPHYRDSSPTRTWTFDAPLTLAANDKIRVSCTWLNDTGETLLFPKEMCASVFWVYPTTDPLVCSASPL